jgi:hypothetical protein
MGRNNLPEFPELREFDDSFELVCRYSIQEYPVTRKVCQDLYFTKVAKFYKFLQSLCEFLIQPGEPGFWVHSDERWSLSEYSEANIPTRP